MAGLATTIVKLLKAKPYNAEPERDAADQGGGFLLGAAKGAIVASFLFWGLQQHEDAAEKLGPWVQKQVATSRGLVLSRTHRPAERLWNAPPVQSFVTRVKSRGMWSPSPIKPPPAPSAELTEPVQASVGRGTTMELPKLDPASPDFLRDLDRLMDAAGLRDGSH